MNSNNSSNKVDDNLEEGLVNSLSKEISNTSFDLSVDYLELTLDQVVQEGVLKEIPFVKTLYSLGKIGISIREKFFVKKLLVFLKEFHSAKLTSEELTRFRDKFSDDIKYREKATEHIMVYVDSFLEAEKAKMLARLFAAHVGGAFDWQHFINLSACLDSIQPGAYEFLRVLSENNFEISNDPDKRFMPRTGELEALLVACGVGFERSAWASSFNVSKLGQDLFNYGIKG